MKLITPYMEWMRLTYYFGVDCKVREYWVQHFGVLCLWKVLFDWLSVLKLFSLFFSHHNLASTFLLVSVSKLILQGDWSKPCKTNQVHLPPSIACIIQSLIRLPYIRRFLPPEKKKSLFTAKFVFVVVCYILPRKAVLSREECDSPATPPLTLQFVFQCQM